MGAHGRGEATTPGVVGRRRIALPAPLALVIAILALQSGTAGAAEGPTIEAASSGYHFVWSPPTAEVAPGGTVNFKSPSASVPHGVTWKSVPEDPSCSNVPIDSEKTSWSGSCTFATAGSYAFVCTVHPVEMKGSIEVKAGGTGGPNPPPPADRAGSPLSGPASQALRIRKAQSGNAVRGSIGLSQAAAGARLTVDLLARRAALLSARGAATVRVGRLARSSVGAGRVSFKVSLKPSARRALKRHGRLRLTVRVTVTPPGRDATKLTRGVVLHV
jgi:plastocyanin